MSTAKSSSLRPLSAMDIETNARQDSLVNRDREQKRLQDVQRLARWMDNSFSIPGTTIRFGWDSLIGLIPGLGDVATAAVGGWILREAHRVGATKATLVKMLANIAVDLSVGAVPLLGDLFDVYWKSNARNAKLLEDHLTERSKTVHSK